LSERLIELKVEAVKNLNLSANEKGRVMGNLHIHSQFETRISSEFTELKSMIKANVH
jgi:DNA topoisomerase VI subunit A